MVNPERVLLLFVDGLGIPPEDLSRSAFSEMPTLRWLLEDHGRPLDATLGVDGIPQSATGQTAIFTGLNAAKMLGRHVEGFPPAILRETIVENNLFKHLQENGKRCSFANAYATMPGCELPLMYRSVTTVMTLGALGGTLGKEDLIAGRAVYHDLTRRTLGLRGVKDVPIVTEEEAANHLIGISRGVDLCLFEYFLTDHAGHGRADAGSAGVLCSLEHFLGYIIEQIMPERELLLMVSDHGNIENTETRGHTMNPVPLVAFGCGAKGVLTACSTIQDVCPAIVRLLMQC